MSTITSTSSNISNDSAQKTINQQYQQSILKWQFVQVFLNDIKNFELKINVTGVNGFSLVFDAGTNGHDLMQINCFNENSNDKISGNDLLNADGRCSLQKYISAYYQIISTGKFSHIKNLIIFINVPFYSEEDNKIIFHCDTNEKIVLEKLSKDSVQKLALHIRIDNITTQYYKIVETDLKIVDYTEQRIKDACQKIIFIVADSNINIFCNSIESQYKDDISEFNLNNIVIPESGFTNVSVKSFFEETASGVLDGYHGMFFALSVSMLLFIRSVIRKLENFTMQTEVRKGGKFDDIIFTEKQEQYRCLQLKHKRNMYLNKIEHSDVFSNLKGDFGLLKYVCSYWYIQENQSKFKNSIKDAIVFTNSYFESEGKLVFIRNVSLNHKEWYDGLKQITLEKVSSFGNDILKMNHHPAKYYKLNNQDISNILLEQIKSFDTEIKKEFGPEVLDKLNEKQNIKDISNILLKHFKSCDEKIAKQVLEKLNKKQNIEDDSNILLKQIKRFDEQTTKEFAQKLLEKLNEKQKIKDISNILLNFFNSYGEEIEKECAQNVLDKFKLKKKLKIEDISNILLKQIKSFDEEISKKCAQEVLDKLNEKQNIEDNLKMLLKQIKGSVEKIKKELAQTVLDKFKLKEKLKIEDISNILQKSFDKEISKKCAQEVLDKLKEKVKIEDISNILLKHFKSCDEEIAKECAQNVLDKFKLKEKLKSEDISNILLKHFKSFDEEIMKECAQKVLDMSNEKLKIEDISNILLKQIKSFDEEIAKEFAQKVLGMLNETTQTNILLIQIESIDDEIKEEFSQEVLRMLNEKKNIKEALDKITYAVCQPNQRKIFRLIQKEMECHFKRLPGSLVETMYLRLKSDLANWFDNNSKWGSNINFSHTNEFFQKYNDEFDEFEIPPLKLNILQYKIREKFENNQVAYIPDLPTESNIIGKTEIAIQIAKNYKESDSCNRVFWIDAKKNSVIKEKLKRICRLLNLTVANCEPMEEIINKILNNFEKKNVLFVFDNAKCKKDKPISKCLSKFVDIVESKKYKAQVLINAQNQECGELDVKSVQDSLKSINLNN